MDLNELYLGLQDKMNTRKVAASSQEDVQEFIFAKVAQFYGIQDNAAFRQALTQEVSSLEGLCQLNAEIDMQLSKDARAGHVDYYAKLATQPNELAARIAEEQAFVKVAALFGAEDTPATRSMISRSCGGRSDVLFALSAYVDAALAPMRRSM